MSTASNPGIDLDLMAAAAQTRLAAFINRTAAQQMRRMRESWGEADSAPTCTRATNTPVAAAQLIPTVFMPWDDITAIEDPSDELTTLDMVGIALQVVTVCAFIFASGFGLGYLSAGH